MTDMRSRAEATRSGGRARAVLRIATVLAVAGIAAACEKGVTTASIPDDYRQRHPISLSRQAATLEVFVGRTASGLDRRQAEDVSAFGRDFMQTGEGPLVAYLPVGAPAGSVNAGLAGIRGALAGGGAAGRLHIAHYHPEQPGAPAIRLTFAKLKAVTTPVCSYEDSELIPSRLRDHNENKQSYNLGCAYQRNLAAQVADPRDLVRARQDGPIDVERRTAGIQRIRKNEAQELKPGGKTLKSLVTE
jgi:pilus assembly protein CpaD